MYLFSFVVVRMSKNTYYILVINLLHLETKLYNLAIFLDFILCAMVVAKNSEASRHNLAKLGYPSAQVESLPAITKIFIDSVCFVIFSSTLVYMQ